MVAWRGLVIGEDHPELVEQLQQEYPQLQGGVTFEMNTAGGSNVIYMIPPRKINWLWCDPPFLSPTHTVVLIHFTMRALLDSFIGYGRYKAGPEPDLPGQSVTRKPTPEEIAELHEAADEIWNPAFASLIKVLSSAEVSLA